MTQIEQDIKEIKSLALLDQPVKTGILADQLSTRSKEIRNQVAALVSENKISEQEENVEPVLEKLPQNTLGDTQPEQKIEEDSSLVGRDSPHSEEGD